MVATPGVANFSGAPPDVVSVGEVAAGGLVDVGGVMAVFAPGHFVFAGLGRHHELVREFASHDAGVRLDRHGA